MIWNHVNWSQNHRAIASVPTHSDHRIPLKIKWSVSIVEPKHIQPVENASHQPLINSQISKKILVVESKETSKKTVKAQDRKKWSAVTQNQDLQPDQSVERAIVQNTIQQPVDDPKTVDQTSHSKMASHEMQVESITPVKTSSIKAINRRVNYPNRARALGVEGKVTVQFDITENGTVKNINVLSETPIGVFADAVRQDMSRWRYEASQSLMSQKVTILFKLSGQVVVENN